MTKDEDFHYENDGLWPFNQDDDPYLDPLRPDISYPRFFGIDSLDLPNDHDHDPYPYDNRNPE
jgi:hypothetical protein